MLGHCPKERKKSAHFETNMGTIFLTLPNTVIYSNEYIQVIVERASQLPSLIWFLQTHTHTTCIFRQKPFGNEIKKKTRDFATFQYTAIHWTRRVNEIIVSWLSRKVFFCPWTSIRDEMLLVDVRVAFEDAATHPPPYQGAWTQRATIYIPAGAFTSSENRAYICIYIYIFNAVLCCVDGFLVCAKTARKIKMYLMNFAKMNE